MSTTTTTTETATLIAGDVRVTVSGHYLRIADALDFGLPNLEVEWDGDRVRIARRSNGRYESYLDGDLPASGGRWFGPLDYVASARTPAAARRQLRAALAEDLSGVRVIRIALPRR
jgi:CHASE1-domain containing sensor protein